MMVKLFFIVIFILTDLFSFYIVVNMLGVAYLIHFIYKIVHFEYVQLKAYGERVALFCPPLLPFPPSNKARVQMPCSSQH